METTQNLSFQSLPQESVAKLKQLIKELPIENIFFHPATTTEPAHLVINAFDTKNIEVIETRKWLRRDLKEHSILLHVLGARQMRFAYKNGNPFIPIYCTKAALLYQNSRFTALLPKKWRDFKKRYKKYEHEYFHHHDILMTMANEFYGLDARTSVYLTYRSLYEHHLSYLESLYIGRSFQSKVLDQRIKYLSQYIASIEDLFVKQNGTTYYLLAQLEKAKQAAEEGDEMYINWELYYAISDVEKQLYTMVCDRFQALKKQIKANKKEHKSLVAASERMPVKEKLLDVVLQINKIQQTEEIYLLYKTQSPKLTRYYLLLIGEGLGTEILNRMQQTITTKLGGQSSLILIGHSRFWIQDKLFIHQKFFKSIIRSENRIFKAPVRNFTMHWEEPHKPCYGDLDYMYKSTTNMFSNYFILREYAEAENAEGLNNLFSHSLLRFFRTFVFATLSYQPHYLSANDLWLLCLFAQPTLGNMEYLFKKLSGDNFFKEVDYNTKFHHNLGRVPKEKHLVMDEILKVMSKELKIVYETTFVLSKKPSSIDTP